MVNSTPIVFLPILAYLLVLLVVAAVLLKFKILGDSKWVAIFVSLIIAALFISATGATRYVGTIVPWFAVLIVALFLIWIMLSFIGGDILKNMSKGIGGIFVIVLLLVFLASALFVFSDILLPYLPGPYYGAGGDEAILFFTDWLYSERIVMGIILLIVSVLAAWILVKAK